MTGIGRTDERRRAPTSDDRACAPCRATRLCRPPGDGRMSPLVETACTPQTVASGHWRIFVIILMYSAFHYAMVSHFFNAKRFYSLKRYITSKAYINVKTLSLRSTQSLQWANSIKNPIMFSRKRLIFNYNQVKDRGVVII